MISNTQYDASSYLEQFPKNQMWQWELREGGIPGLVTGREGGRPHVQRQDQVLLHVLQDQVVAHNLDVGDDLVDQALDVTRRSTLEIETGYDRNISWIILEEFLQNLLLLLLLGLPLLLPCRLAACNAACILTACHRAEKVVTNDCARFSTLLELYPLVKIKSNHLARSPGNLRTHSIVLIVRTIGSVFSRVQGTWIWGDICNL